MTDNQHIQIAFTTKCLDRAKENNLSLDDLVTILTKGLIRRLEDGHLGFLYQGAQIVTCENARFALDVKIIRNEGSRLIYKSPKDLSDYELAMVA